MSLLFLFSEYKFVFCCSGHPCPELTLLRTSSSALFIIRGQGCPQQITFGHRCPKEQVMQAIVGNSCPRSPLASVSYLWRPATLKHNYSLRIKLTYKL